MANDVSGMSFGHVGYQQLYNCFEKKLLNRIPLEIVERMQTGSGDPSNQDVLRIVQKSMDLSQEAHLSLDSTIEAAQRTLKLYAQYPFNAQGVLIAESAQYVLDELLDVHYAFSHLPENLQIQENYDAILANGENAKAVYAATWKLYGYFTQEYLNAIITSGKNAEVVVDAILGDIAARVIAKGLAFAIQSLPENLQTQENRDALRANERNAGEIVTGILSLPENLQTQEYFNAFLSIGAKAFTFNCAFRRLPKDLKIQENIDALLSIGEKVGTVNLIIMRWPISTQENFEALMASKLIATESPISVSRALAGFPKDLLTQQNFDALMESGENATDILRATMSLPKDSFTQEIFDILVASGKNARAVAFAMF